MRPEQLRVYQAAEALCAEVDHLLALLPSSAASRADHLVRAADSTLFNVAKGAGALSPRVKAAAYEVARKEAQEVRAVLRRLVIARVVAPTQIEKPYNLADTVIAMVTTMIRNLNARKNP